MKSEKPKTQKRLSEKDAEGPGDDLEDLSKLPFLPPEEMQKELEEAYKRVKRDGVVLLSASSVKGPSWKPRG